MVVRTGLQNIPILRSLPDIPNMYASNPNFSFIVDLIVLCVMFGTILAPLGQRVLGSKKSGKQFGAVLGIIFGASAAFALNAAGVGLFKYWLTILFLGIVLSVIFYKILMALHVSKGLAGFICLALAWLLLDLAFIEGGLGSDRVQTGFGAASVLFVILAAIAMIFWFLIKGFGGGGGIGGSPGAQGPLGGWWDDMKGGWKKGGLWGLAKGILKGPRRIITGRGISEDEERLRHEEGRGALGRISEDEARLRHEEGRGEAGKKAGEAETAIKDGIDASESGQKKAGRTIIDITNAINAINALLAKPYLTADDLKKFKALLVASIFAALQNLRNDLARIGKAVASKNELLKRIQETIKNHNTLMTKFGQMNIEEELNIIRQRINSIQNPAQKSAFGNEFNRIIQELNIIKTALQNLSGINGQLQQYQRLLENKNIEILYAQISSRLTRISQYMTAVNNYIDALITRPPQSVTTPSGETIMVVASPEQLRKILNASKQFLEKADIEFASTEQTWKSISDSLKAEHITIKQIQKTIADWGDIVIGMQIENKIANAVQSISALGAAITQQIAAEQAVPAPTPPPAPGAAPGTPPAVPPEINAAATMVKTTKDNVTSEIRSLFDLVSGKKGKFAVKQIEGYLMALQDKTRGTDPDMGALRTALQTIQNEIKKIEAKEIPESAPLKLALQKMEKGIITFIGEAPEISKEIQAIYPLIDAVSKAKTKEDIAAAIKPTTRKLNELSRDAFDWVAQIDFTTTRPKPQLKRI